MQNTYTFRKCGICLEKCHRYNSLLPIHPPHHFYMRNIALILSKVFKDIIYYFQYESWFLKVA